MTRARDNGSRSESRDAASWLGAQPGRVAAQAASPNLVCVLAEIASAETENTRWLGRNGPIARKLNEQSQYEPVCVMDGEIFG